MLKLKMDYSKCDDGTIQYDDCEIFEEDVKEYRCNMKSYICDVLYNSKVEYFYKDNDIVYQSIYGCDDVGHFFDDYEDNIESTSKKEDFVFESHVQGNKLYLNFYYKQGKYNVKIDHYYGKVCSEEDMDYDYVKNMFYSFFNSIFEFISKKCKGIDDDEMYNMLKKYVYKIKS